MNDSQATCVPTTASESQQKSEKLWDKTVAFLNRDIRSFLPGREAPVEALTLKGRVSADSIAATAPDSTVESLVDFKKLPDMAFRRDVLDWRDNFHANITSTLVTLHDRFIRLVDNKLDNTNLFRKLITRPADEVLQDDFVLDIRMPLIMALRKEEEKLTACAQKWGLIGEIDFSFDTHRLRAECVSLNDIGFKQSNRSLIVSRMQNLMLGPLGIAENLCEQGLHMSRKLMENKQS
jgi:hypothetical protein